MLKDFRAFIMKGNVIDLAVAVVIGAAFGAVITSVVDNFITPILGLFGDKDFSQYGLTLKEATATNPAIVLGWGAILTAVINFVAVAAAIFFLVIKPIQAIEARRKRGEEPDEETTPEDIALLTEIRDLLRARQ